MRNLWVAAAAILLAGCSKQANDNPTAHFDDEKTTSAPGVAWSFDYDYLLADDQIEGVQERHASRCEQLGLARCRITGLRYSVGSDDSISGSLTVQLDPRIARQFGRLALGDVRGADGKLLRSEYVGEDVGTGVKAAQAAASQSETQQAELERRIAGAKPGSVERAELQRQLSELIAQAADQRTAAAAGEQRLAFTPVTFTYVGEGGVAGFRENPLKASYKLLVASFVTMISLVLKVVGLLLPWLVLAWVLVLLWRSRPGRWLRHWLVAREGLAPAD